MRRVAALTGLVIAFLATPAGAASGGNFILVSFGSPDFHEIKQWDMNVRFAGSVVVRYSGPGESGTIVWSPGRDGQFTVAVGRDRAGHPQYSGYLGPSGGQMTVAQVTRAAGTCADRRETLFDSAAITNGGRALAIGLVPSRGSTSGLRLTETNCGGPLATAFRHLFHPVHVPARSLAKGKFDVDLRGAGSFTDGPLGGTVESTVVAHVGRRLRPPSDKDFGPITSHRYRELDVHYAIERVSGTLGAAFKGGELCEALASCGDAGTWVLRAGRAHGTMVVRVLTRVSQPLHDLKAAAGLVRAGRGHLPEMDGSGSWSSRGGSLAATSSGCSDRRPSGDAALRIARRGRSAIVTVYSAAGILRTRCPGPGVSDDVSGSPLARARIPLRALGRRRVRIHVGGGVAIDTDGWSGATKPDLTIVLRRTRVRTSVERF